MEKDGNGAVQLGGSQMARSRQTISVENVRSMTNAYLAATGPNQRDLRRGACTILERVLMDTGNYRGFRYLETYRANDPTFDESRRFYY